MALRLPVLLEASAVTCAGAPLVNDMMRKEKEHADIHERANQHRHRQRGQGLAAAWAWLKLAPRLPVLLEASADTCATCGCIICLRSPWLPRWCRSDLVKRNIYLDWKIAAIVSG